jgi:hypothetical protein
LDIGGTTTRNDGELACGGDIGTAEHRRRDIADTVRGVRCRELAGEAHRNRREIGMNETGRRPFQKRAIKPDRANGRVVGQHRKGGFAAQSFRGIPRHARGPLQPIARPARKTGSTQSADVRP